MARGETYTQFVSKFKPKKTTDDCYTPPAIYEAVKNWAVREYKLEGKNIVRPFYPGGDYEHYPYKPEDVVIDNPPFSILAKILDWYRERNIPFFLFAPGLTFFAHLKRGTLIITACDITYDNSANVETGFITNMDDCAVRIAPTLAEKIRAANKLNRKPEKPRYKYPDNLLTYSACQLSVIIGKPDYKIYRDEVSPVQTLDSQRPMKKSIFGHGAFISDRVASNIQQMKKEHELKERELKERELKEWALSDDELKIISQLNKK